MDENETNTDAVSANAVVPTTADTSTGNTEAPTAMQQMQLFQQVEVLL